MWVSRLRARFQGLQIQWLSSPLGAEGPARLCPGPTLPGYISPEPWQERDARPPPGARVVSQQRGERVALGSKGASLEPRRLHSGQGPAPAEAWTPWQP